MNIESYIIGFKTYLQLEKSLSKNSIEAYINDVKKLVAYFKTQEEISITEVKHTDLQLFAQSLFEIELSAGTQARIISGVRAFFAYLMLENILNTNPADLLVSPKLPKKLPTYLSIEEVDLILETFDLSTTSGQRNRAIIEVLYGCGLRV